MKRILSALLIVSVLTGMLAVNASAEDAVTSGKCGENLTWSRDGSRIVISGTGAMYDYSPESPAPWEKFVDVYSCEIENGVTTIGDYAFARDSLAGLRITVAPTVTHIGEKAFAFAQRVITFLGSAPTIASNAFEDAHGMAAYIYGWEEEDRKSYGGRMDWVKGKLEQTTDSKMLYAINEEINPEDFKLKATFNGGYAITYTPQAIQTDPYDNSAYGEKSIKVLADGFEFVHTYFVSDGQNHLDFVKVDPLAAQYYTGKEIKAEPIVTAGTLTLTEDVHYSLSYKNNTAVGANAQVTVTGIGDFEGFSQTIPFHILRQDISTADAGVGRQRFLGTPLIPDISVYANQKHLTAGEDYVVFYENNVNMGTASYCVVGVGGYHGYKTGTFQIHNQLDPITLSGAYNGQATGELNDQVYYQEILLTPGYFTGQIDSVVGSYVKDHYAYYALYEVVGEETTLVTTLETEYGYGSTTEFSYDFSSIYEDAAEEGGAVYMLAYSWLNSDASVYSGICALYIPAKVPEATSMVVEQVEGAGDFRRTYLSAYGPDGNVGEVAWTTSDPSIATVNGGVVTMKSPGTVTITGQYGLLTDSETITVTAKNFTQCDFLSFNRKTQKVELCYENILLTEGTDYVRYVSVREDVTEVTVTGRGLFTGQQVKQFNTVSGEEFGHAHCFDNCEDTTCGTCTFERSVGHTYSEQWSKNETQHWHSCTACGEKTDIAQHTVSAADATICEICGPMYNPGDLNGDENVNEDDAIYLLQHILLPDFFPITQDADYTADNRLDEDDAIYLLQHVLLPDFFPL